MREKYMIDQQNHMRHQKSGATKLTPNNRILEINNLYQLNYNISLIISIFVYGKINEFKDNRKYFRA